MITKDFLKKVPSNLKESILVKLSYFNDMLEKAQGHIKELPAGFWIKKITGTNIFKFRLNNKDRILFTYIKDQKIDKTAKIIFLDYCNHDEQIRKGQRMDTQASLEKSIDLDILTSSTWNHAEVEDNDNTFVKSQRTNNSLILNDLVSIVVEDHYISLLLDEKNSDYLYYLSNEQWKCLEHRDKPILLLGAAGSGKTTVAVQKLLWCQKNRLKACYITNSDLLMENIKNLYEKYKLSSENIATFYSIKKWAQEIKQDNSLLVTFEEFNNWFVSNRYKYKKLKKINTFYIWSEIRTLIKGFMGFEFKLKNKFVRNNNILSKEEYLLIPKDYSIFDKSTKEAIYDLTEAYTKWLNETNRYDECDLSFECLTNLNEQPKYDFIIVDEVQDFTEVQLYLLSQMVKDQSQILYTGDLHQMIIATFFEFGRLKNMYYSLNTDTEERILSKNYRSVSGIVTFLNRLIEIRKTKIGFTPFDYEEGYIRIGQKPTLVTPKEDVLSMILDSVKDKHYSAVIVPDEEERARLEKINPEATGRIFTINEIKGLEYSTVFCINVITKNSAIWEDIVKGLGKRQTKYRHSFNLFYVATSRAMDNLYIYEEDTKNLMLNEISSYVETMTECNYEKLSLKNKSTKEDWAKEAYRLEKIGNTKKSDYALKLSRDLPREEYIRQVNKQIEEKEVSNITKDFQKLKDKHDFEQYLQKGKYSIRKKDFTKAVDFFNNVIEKYPDHAEGYYYLGVAYSYMVSGSDYSIRYFDQTLSIKPEWYEVYLDKASTLRFLKNYEKAIETMDNAIAVDATIGNGYFIKGLLLYDLGKYVEAIQLFEKALTLPCYIFDTIDKSWNRNPSTDKESIFKNNIRKHITECKNALNSKTEAKPPTELERVMFLWSVTSNRHPKAKKYKQYALTFIDNNEFEEALIYLEKALKFSPNDFEILNYKGYVLNELEKYNEAVDVLENIVSSKPPYPLVYYTLGEAYKGIKAYTNAINAYTTSIELDPNVSIAYYNRGKLYIMIYQFDKAIEDFNQILYLNNDSTVSSLALKEIFYIKTFQKVLSSMNLSKDILDMLGTMDNFNLLFKHISAVELNGKTASSEEELKSNIRNTFQKDTQHNSNQIDQDFSCFNFDSTRRTITDCIEKAIPLNIKYNSNNKKFTVQFNKAECVKCLRYNQCPMNRSDSKGVLKFRKEQVYKS
ncbi:tetratricopeptide repeat protein [Heliorestis convoluta]|uniref:tetratricopeptide repeat protein n=1 Tax=Heliorestis convoluta TaxID=356322 RepID=UPI00129BC7EA|nr:tetratricopeptide repeat protein [Heliorestis convoluta]